MTTTTHAQVAIRPHHGRPTVFVNDQPLVLTGYSPVAGRRMELFKQQTARFFPHRLGVYLITMSSAVSNDFHATTMWVGDEIRSEHLLPENGGLDEQVAHVLKGDPNAWLIIRFGTHEPADWRALHPEELFVTEEGKRLEVPSLASELFNQYCAKYVAAVIGHCEAKPWAHRIIGYANFLRMEGTHEPIVDGWLFDHGPRMRERFGRPVLKDKLRGAASDVTGLLYWPEVKVDAASRRVDPEGMRRDAASTMTDLRDYLRLQRDLFHEHFRVVTAAMQAAVKQTGRERFLIYDALKQPMMGWSNAGFFTGDRSWPLAFPEDRAGSGHIGVAPLFDLPGFDGLITPHDYQARGIGGVYQPEGAADSVVLRGKLMFCEMDTRSWTGTDVNYPARNLQEFAAITWRNIADGLTRGYQSYWMDVYQDWFADEKMHELIASQVRVLKESVSWPHADVPGIAMILDDEAILETNGDGRFFNEAIMWEMKQGLARCGVPFRVYLLDDLQQANFPAHRVFYFPNLFRITAERRALLEQKVFKNGHVVVWGPGSGIAEGADVTGFAFDVLPINYPRRVMVSNFAHPITRGLPADTIYGSPLAYGPVLLPRTDEKPETSAARRSSGEPRHSSMVKASGAALQSCANLAAVDRQALRLGEAWTKAGRVAAGLAVREMDGWQSVFTTAVPVPADLWRGLARFAGAHVYSEENDVVLADAGLVAVHSVKSGPKTIRLPGRFTVTELTPGDRFAEPTDVIQFELTGPATRVFQLSR